jgi:hypothetical protein
LSLSHLQVTRIDQDTNTTEGAKEHECQGVNSHTSGLSIHAPWWLEPWLIIDHAHSLS